MWQLSPVLQYLQFRGQEALEPATREAFALRDQICTSKGAAPVQARGNIPFAGEQGGTATDTQVQDAMNVPVGSAQNFASES